MQEAIERYEQLCTIAPERKDRLFIRPKYHYEAAKLYQETGNAERAIFHLEAFLEAWKTADRGLSESADARSRLKKLKHAATG
jgi:hypothetical protein